MRPKTEYTGVGRTWAVSQCLDKCRKIISCYLQFPSFSLSSFPASPPPPPPSLSPSFLFLFPSLSCIPPFLLFYFIFLSSFFISPWSSFIPFSSIFSRISRILSFPPFHSPSLLPSFFLFFLYWYWLLKTGPTALNLSILATTMELQSQPHSNLSLNFPTL